MDKSSITGILLGMIAVGVGMVLKGVSLMALFNPAAILIIFLGTAASVCISFPVSTIKKVPSLFKILFVEKKETDEKDLIVMFINWGNQIRQEGVLSLERELDKVDDPFLKSGLQLIIDGETPEFVEEVMLEKISAMEKRHEEGAAVFSRAGTYAPTLGVLGAVIGLIAALGNIEDMDVLGEAISAAFMATLFGIFSGYVLWHPFANKLREKSKREVHKKEMIIEGVQSLISGESAIAIKEKLGSFLSEQELADIDQEDIHAKKETA
ncbi:MAG TPA: flagellar motor stator protein MotA [Bacillota bacterium]|nr:flagellar motor stator protein MotA [Bacillota bacterium]